MRQDLNAPRPVVAGGTGGTSPATALTNIGAEKNNQIVTNFDTHPWVSGSFSAGTGTVGAVDSDHVYSGIAYVTDADNVVVECRDRNDARDFIYLRRKVDGVWSSWGVDGSGLFARQDEYVAKAGDTMTGPLTLPPSMPTVATYAAHKQYVDSGDLTIANYADTQDALRVLKAGDSMTGTLAFSGLPFAAPAIAINGPSPWFNSAITVNFAGTAKPALELNDTTFADNTNILSIGNQPGDRSHLLQWDGNQTIIKFRGMWGFPDGPLIVGPGPLYAAGAAALNVGYTGGFDQFGAIWRCQGNGPTTIHDFFVGPGPRCGSITIDAGNSTLYNTTCDERLKTDLKQFDAARIVEQTNVYDFAWKDTPGVRAYGVLAQQAQEVYPQAVTYIPKSAGDDSDWWGIDYSKYVPVILQELKSLRARVADLEGRATIDPKRR